jgi:hypothetical protein
MRSGAMRRRIVDAKSTSNPGATLMAPVARSLTMEHAHEAKN